jgi:hypothetical protein
MMIRSPESRDRRGPRSGFTMVEVAMAGALMSLLVILISGAWRGLGRSSTDATVRSRVVHEANLAAAALARDFGGSLPGQPTGGKEEGRLVGWLVTAGPELRLYYDGTPNIEIVYSLVTETTYGRTWKRLVRWNADTGSEFTVATNVDTMELTDLGDRVQIDLTLTYRDLTRTYTFVGKGP